MLMTKSELLKNIQGSEVFIYFQIAPDFYAHLKVAISLADILALYADRSDDYVTTAEWMDDAHTKIVIGSDAA